MEATYIQTLLMLVILLMYFYDFSLVLPGECQHDSLAPDFTYFPASYTFRGMLYNILKLQMILVHKNVKIELKKKVCNKFASSKHFNIWIWSKMGIARAQDCWKLEMNFPVNIKLETRFHQTVIKITEEN